MQNLTLSSTIIISVRDQKLTRHYTLCIVLKHHNMKFNQGKYTWFYLLKYFHTKSEKEKYLP